MELENTVELDKFLLYVKYINQIELNKLILDKIIPLLNNQFKIYHNSKHDNIKNQFKFNNIHNNETIFL